MAGTARELEQALALHRQGKLDEAEGLYRRIVAAAPRDAEALDLYGVLEFQRGRHDAAVPLFERAVAGNVGNPYRLTAGLGSEVKDGVQRVFTLDRNVHRIVCLAWFVRQRQFPPA